MANPRFGPPSIFINGRKIGEFVQHKLTLASGDELQYGDGGVVGHSDGAETSKLTANGVVPRAGMATDLVALLQAKQDVDVSVGVLDGKIRMITMRFETAEFSGDHKAGTLMGDFSLSGGKSRAVDL